MVGVVKQNVAEDITPFLNYAVTYPDAYINYHASAMVLHRQ